MIIYIYPIYRHHILVLQIAKMRCCQKSGLDPRFFGCSGLETPGPWNHSIPSRSTVASTSEAKQFSTSNTKKRERMQSATIGDISGNLVNHKRSNPAFVNQPNGGRPVS